MKLSLQDIVANPEKFLIRPSNFNQKSVLEKTATKIIEKFGDFNPVEPPDIDEIFLRVYEKLNNNDDNISIKDLKLVASYIYRSGTEDAFINKYLKYIEKINISRIWSALIAYYIMQFDEEKEITKKVGKVLSKNKDSFSKRWKKSVEFINFLDVKSATENISKEIIIQKSNITVLQKMNFRGAFLSSSLVKDAILKCAQKISKEFHKENFDNFYIFLKILAPENRIKEINGSAAMLCYLEPLDKIDLSGAKRNELQNLFIESFGDPRINQSKWPEIPERFGGSKVREKCILIVKKWLIFKTIDMFFKIIEQHADHQFKPRQDLWERYFEGDHIIDAEVILGKRPASTARELKKNDEEAKVLRWADLSGALSDQSVLLMRLSNGLTIAEWSHSGSFRAWTESNDKKPRFLRSFYTAASLRSNSDWHKVHKGYWVNDVERYIRKETGIRI
jgi:hypothetical protein